MARKFFLVCAAVLCLLGASSILPSQSFAGAEDGAEFVGYVGGPKLVARPGGGAFVLAGAGTDLYLTPLTPLGVREPTWPLWGVRIAPWTSFVAAPDLAGGFYMAWMLPLNPYGRVKLSRFQANGLPAVGWPDTGIVVGTSKRSWSPNLCVDASGAAYVSWYQEGVDGPTSGAFVTRILSDATQAPGWPATGTQISSAASVLGARLILGFGGQGVLACWMQGFGDAGLYPWATRFLSTGSRAPGWPAPGTRLSSVLVYSADDGPQACSDGFGGIIVAWPGVSVFPRTVNATSYTSAGTRAPGWPEDGLQVAQPGAEPTIATDSQGGAFLTWSGDFHVRLQHVSVDGLELLPHGGLQISALVDQSHGQTATADGDGGVYLSWRTTTGSGSGRITRVDATGELYPGWVGDGLQIATGSRVPALVPTPDGGAIVAWDENIGPEQWRTWARRVLPDGTYQSTVDVAPGSAASVRKLTISPLPARDRVALSAGGAEVQSVEILDAMGRVVCAPTRGTSTSATAAWALEDQTGRRLSPGLYFVRALTSKGTLTAKLVVAW